MFKLMFIALLAASLLIACNSETKTEDKSASANESTTAEKPNYAYAVDYSSSFEIGKTKYSETILNLWKDFDKGDLTPCKNVFADSVWMTIRDGSKMAGPKDSIIAGAQSYRDQFASVQSRVDAIVPLRSTDQNEDWVCVWGTETTTDKKGKVDSVRLQESWQFDKDGKVKMMLQYGQAAK